MSSFSVCDSLPQSVSSRVRRSLAKSFIGSFACISMGLGSMACGKDANDQIDISRVDTIAQLAGQRVGEPDTVLIVVLSPSTCFNCSELVLSLLALASAEPASTKIVLSRRPNAAEQSQLALQRVKPVTVLDDATANSADDFVALATDGRATHVSPLKRIVADSVLLNYIRVKISN